MADVAILGVGRMGGALARRLCAAGHTVVLWNRTRAAAEEAANDTGAQVADSAADAVRGARLVISMLSSGAVTCDVLLAPEFVTSLQAGAIVCDMGTSGVASARLLASSLEEAGVRFIDAPVSGSVATIGAGQLLVMASGDSSAVAEFERTAACFAKRVVYLGAAGSGQAMKLSVNLVVHALNSALSEALALAAGAGIDPHDSYDVFQDSVIAAPFVLYKRQAFLEAATPVAMSLGLTNKDLGLILEQARDIGLHARVAEAVRDEVATACADGWSDRDMASLALWLQGEDSQP